MIHMNRILGIVLVALLFCCGTGFAQGDIFERYSDKDNVSSIYISKSMFQLMQGCVSAGELDLKGIKDKIDNLQVLTSEDGNTLKRMKADFEAHVKNGYELLMKVKDEDSSRVSLYVKKSGENVKELLMLVDDTGEYVTIRITGDFTLQEIMQLTDSM